MAYVGEANYGIKDVVDVGTMPCQVEATEGYMGGVSCLAAYQTNRYGRMCVSYYAKHARALPKSGFFFVASG